MRLTDLEAEFCHHEPGRYGTGVHFWCPCCMGGCTILCWFANPLDGGPPAPPEFSPIFRWQREGFTIDTLTLSPSVDASRGNPPHWHGWVQNGSVNP